MARTARLLFYFLLIWAPLPVASNRPLLWALNGVLAVIVVLLFLLGESGKEARADVDWQPVAVAATAFAVVALWMTVQALPDVPAVLRHPAWDAIPNAAGAISINPSSTWTTLAEVLPIGMLALVATRLSVDRRRTRFLLALIVTVITTVAAYGLIADATGFRQVFLVDTVAYPGAVTGTFIGRNAAATYFVIGIACATAIIAARTESILDAARTDDRRSRLLSAAELIRTAGLYLLADLVLTAALINTGSRGGTLAGGVALLTIALVSLRRTGGKRGTLAAMLAAIVGAVFTVVAVSSDFLFARLETGVGSGDRIAVYGDTLDMIRARPLLGHGGGAFLDAYPLYHLRASSAFLWNRAHDTYLQAAAELGLPAFAILIAGLVVVVVVIARAALRQRDETHPAAVAALAVAAATAFHSVVDFSLQVQAVGLTAAVVVGAGLGESIRRRHNAVNKQADAALIAASVNQRETINVTIPTAAGKGAPAAT